MIRLSFAALYLASILLLRLMSVAQLGPAWEVPAVIAGEIYTEFFVVLGLITLSEAVLWFARRSFADLPKIFKVIYVAWSATILAALLISWNLDVEQWPARFPAVSRVVSVSFWPGVIVSTLLLVLLLIGNRRAK